MQAIDAPATKQSATPAETAAITKLLAAVTGSTLQNLRAGVSNNAIAPIPAFTDYTTLIEGIPGVFQSEATSMTNATAATQGFGLIETILEREEIRQQDALLAGALASGTFTTDERVGFEQAAGREMDDAALSLNTLSTTENQGFASYYNGYDGGAAIALNKDRVQVQQAVEAGFPLAALEAKGVNSGTWSQINDTVAGANFQGGQGAAVAALATDRSVANSARTKVYITGAIGLLGLILSLILTILLARSINRRLSRLRRQAMLLAEEHLPSVVSRLRRGETVDVDSEAAPLRVGNDEIGQVGQAFDAVRLTAIASAVEEARLRQGVNDVFRNLARRNQSLLQRQLTSLDQMERRATDPEVLDDLFKLDHLTTRMRRHAEGLIILSGAPPGRGWSAPVRLIDVMRGAVSEVEDYARVQVATQSKAALSGAAVTDVIHLLAELIENATSLSPPYTQVRVSGEPVTNGFAIEIEDRGLGMNPERLAELNDRLANPPDVNPANTEQLGLFVVAQLARRHSIHVTLRASPYGGTSAVVLIPRRLVVEDAPAALTSGENPMLKAAAANGSGPPALPSFTPSGTDGGYGPQGPGAGGNGATGNGATGNGGNNGVGRRSIGPHGTGGFPVAQPGGYDRGTPAGSPPDLDTIPVGGYGPRANGSGAYQTGSYQAGGYQPNGAEAGGYQGASRQTGGFQTGGFPTGGYPQQGAQGTGPQRGRHSDEVPVVTGIPVSRDVAPPFDVFSPISRPGGGPAGPYAPDGGTNAPNGGSPDFSNAPYQAAGYGNIEGNGSGNGSGDSDGGEHKGLPRRVRQASLAPQLRDSATSQGGTSAASAGGGVPQATAASLTDMRDTLSAMQRGWQQGRSQSVQRDTEGNPHGA
jgi:signal transduction histidine kinase